jgi:hypothetical protein
MKSRVALVACVDSTDGAWTYVRGNEASVHVVGLTDGECVFVDLEAPTPTKNRERRFIRVDGTHPISFRDFRRYKIGKLSGPSGQPVTAEVMLNNGSNNGE